MIDKSFIDRIVEISTPVLFQIDDRQYSSEPLNSITPPLAHTVLVSTLTGFVDFLGTQTIPQGSIIHVKYPENVNLLGPLDERYRIREELVAAAYADKPPFSFGQWTDHESFVIGLQSAFVQDETTTTILKSIGTVKDSSVREFGDDGVTQAVTAKAGIALSQEVKVPNPVVLRPFRTFMEIEQPDSTFVLRAKAGGSGNPPMFALFLADGKMWRLNAVQAIKEWLKGKGVTLPIIA